MSLKSEQALTLSKPVFSTFQGITEDASMFATPSIPQPTPISPSPLIKTLLFIMHLWRNTVYGHQVGKVMFFLWVGGQKGGPAEMALNPVLIERIR